MEETGRGSIFKNRIQASGSSHCQHCALRIETEKLYLCGVRDPQSGMETEGTWVLHKVPVDMDRLFCICGGPERDLRMCKFFTCLA